MPIAIFVVLILLISVVFGFAVVFISFFAVSFLYLVVFVENTLMKLAGGIIVVFILGGFVVLSFIRLPVRLLIPFFCLVLILQSVFTFLALRTRRRPRSRTPLIPVIPIRFFLIVGSSISIAVVPFGAGAAGAFMISCDFGIGGHGLFMVGK